MEMTIGFGSSPQKLVVPDDNLIGILEPNSVKTDHRGVDAVVHALEHPIGTPRLGEMVRAGEKIAIVTSDVTRPLPSRIVLPTILDELRSAGVRCEDITVVFALGSHRLQTPDEMKKIVGEDVYAQVRCIDSSAEDFVLMGRTAHGTPVEIAGAVARADRRICLGNIEYHYFAGYSGGAKAIMPGVSTRAAIQSNHSLMVRPESVAGRLEDNPVRMDLEEAVTLCPIDFIVNVVLDEHKEIVHAVAGHYITAHRQGCRFLDTLYGKRIEQQADIVIVSQGGSPKDLNLYQTQKALDNAKHAVKKGGIIVLAGSCREGLGERVFEEWMTSASSPQEMIRRIAKDFQLGGHKAAAIAMVLENATIHLVSEMPPDFVRTLFMVPFSTVQEAVDAAFAKAGGHARVLVMPYGGSTLPIVAKTDMEHDAHIP